MAGTVTIKQLIENIAVEEVMIEQSKILDVVDVLNNKISYSESEHVDRLIDIDDNEVSRVDSYGDVSGGGQDANYADRTWLDDSYKIPQSNIVSFTIPYDDLQKFGVTAEILNRSEDEIEASSLTAFSEKINKEVAKLVRKIMVNRRTEMETALAQLGTVSATSFCKPLGLPVVADASDRADHWNYDNLLGVALDEDSYKLGVNLFASNQKNVYNEKFGASRPVIVLHSSDYSLAESLHLPQVSVNQYFRNAGGSLESQIVGTNAVGVYSDTAHPNDWIMLGLNNQIKRKAMKSPFGKETMGITARIYFLDNGSLRLEIRDRSVVVIDSPIDVLKSIVA